MAEWWRRLGGVVLAMAGALLAGGPGRAWASSLAVVPAPPGQVVATIPAGPIVISFRTDDQALLDLATTDGFHVLEGDRAQAIAGIRIVDTRAAGSLPWVMTVEAGPGSVTVTVG